MAIKLSEIGKIARQVIEPIYAPTGDKGAFVDLEDEEFIATFFDIPVETVRELSDFQPGGMPFTLDENGNRRYSVDNVFFWFQSMTNHK